MSSTNTTEAINQKIEALGDSLAGMVTEMRDAEQAERESLAQKVKAIETAIEALKEKREEAERHHLPGVEYAKNGEPEKFSLARAMKVILSGKSQTPGFARNLEKECGYELEVFREMDKQLDGVPEYMAKTINAATDVGGGYTIPETVMQELIPELEAASVLSQMGVRRIDGLVGNVSWVKGGSATADWLDTEAEETITESTPTFGTVSARPHPLAARVRMTWQMVNQSAMVTEAWVRSRMATAIALKSDLAGIQGTGSNGEPLGFRSVSGINTSDFDSPTLDWQGAGNNVLAALRDVVHTLREDDALVQGGRFFWLMEPDALLGFMKSTDVDARPLFLGLNDPTLQNLVGYPVFTTTQLDTAAVTDNVMVFGNANEIGDLNWGTITFATSDSDNDDFSKGRVSIRAIVAKDYVVWQPTAICDVLNMDTTNA